MKTQLIVMKLLQQGTNEMASVCYSADHVALSFVTQRGHTFLGSCCCVCFLGGGVKAPSSPHVFFGKKG